MEAPTSPPPERPRRRARRRPSAHAGWIAFALAVSVAVAADQATKAAVRAALPLGAEEPGLGPFSLHHVRNSGILGGHLQGSALPIGIVTTVALLGLVVFVARRGRRRLLDMAAFGLVLGGGVGNLADRLRLGYVTDFLDRGGSGAFNVADVAILAGLVLLGAATLLRPSLRRSLGPRPSPAEGD